MFWWGSFGSLLPEIIRFKNIISAIQTLPQLNWSYILIYAAISLAYMAAAGGFTIGWKPESEFKAMWVGASFPALVSTMLQAVPALPAKG